MTKEEMLEKLKIDLDMLKSMVKEFDGISKIETFDKPASNIYSSESIRNNMYHACRHISSTIMEIEFAMDTIETGMCHC